MGKYEEALKGLNEAQRLAVTTTEGPVLVIAGPGTGKTQLLTTRIAHILATTDSLPQNILCLTFTDSAAHTMRERLANLIGQAAYDVTISTYHAFGSELIRRFPDYFVEQAGLEPIDDLGIDRLFRQIIAGLPYDNPLKYADLYVQDLKALISDAKRSLLTPNDLRRIAEANNDFLNAANPLVADTLQSLVRLSKKDLPLFEKLAARLGKLNVKSKLPAGITPLAQLLLAELEEALAEAQRIGKQTPLTQWKNNWLARDSEGRFVVDGLAQNRKLQAAAEVYEQYLHELQTAGLFDYDDMILRAVRVLETHNDLRFTLQERYLYLLLDEFQDTNGAQARIVELLTDNPVHEGRPNVLAVGDDDQAIYAFQGAHYSHMLRFAEHYRDVLTVPLTENYRSHADILHTARGIAEQIETRLHHHFPAIEKRLTASNPDLSTGAVVERREAQSDVMQFAWTARRIKQLIEQGMPAHEIAVLAPQHKYLEPLVPFLRQLGIPVRYEKRENILDDPGIMQLLRMSELCLALQRGDKEQSSALWAEVLSFDFWQLPTSLIWQLSWQAADQKTSWTELLLNHKTLKPIALFFLRLSTLAASETLETMTDYLIGSTPLDLAEPNYETFTSPYYTFYFGNLNASADSQQPPTKVLPHFHSSESPLPEVEPERGAFETLGSKVTFPRVNAHLSESGEEPAPNKTSLHDDGRFWELLTNLVVLRARLREYRRGDPGPLYLEDFVDFVAAHRAADIKILNTSPYASATDTVHLMTAFKAKGMEFAAVFVLAVNDEAWGSKTRAASSRISLPANLQQIRYAGATNDERLRLFYVAITRAKTQLYLVSYTQNYAGKALTRLRYLNETSDAKSHISPLLPAAGQLVQPAEDIAPLPTTELAAYWQRRHHAALHQENLHALLQERLSRFQLSPTHLNDFLDLIYCGPVPFFMRTILRFPVTPRPEMQFGNAMHETLEWLLAMLKQRGQLPSKQAVLTNYEQRLRARRLSDHDTAQFRDRGHSALAAFLAQRAPLLEPNHLAEYSFRGEGVFVGDAHLSGKIDRLMVDAKTKTIAIVDYKTGKSFGRWQREAKLHKFRHQLYYYKALVEGSHTFAGYQVADAYLEFIEPDESGRLQTLHLAFNDAEYRRVKALAQIIWRHIRALQLPDIEQYSADLKGIEAFENDLLS